MPAEFELMLNYSEACERNKYAIATHLDAYLPNVRSVLEVGSGSGQHAIFLTSQHPHLIWQASDREQYLDALSINLEQYGISSLPPPIELDVLNHWPTRQYDALFSANSLHIMSWKEVEALFAGAGRAVSRRGWLFIYGPFRYRDGYTSESNREFDAWLKARNSESGIRDFEQVTELAEQHGFALRADVAMPANNQLLIWQRL